MGLFFEKKRESARSDSTVSTEREEGEGRRRMMRRMQERERERAESGASREGVIAGSKGKDVEMGVKKMC